jgi:hypothetical protein
MRSLVESVRPSGPIEDKVELKSSRAAFVTCAASQKYLFARSRLCVYK